MTTYTQLQLNDNIYIRDLANGRLYTNLLFFQRSVYKQKLFSVTKQPNLIKKNTKQYKKPLAKKPGALGHCYSLLILWFGQFKKNTKRKGLSLLFLAL